MKQRSIFDEYMPAYIDLSIICSNCSTVLWAGAYAQGIIGKLKKKIKNNGWIYRDKAGTLCRNCSNKMPTRESKPTQGIETIPTDKDTIRFLNAMGIKAVPFNDKGKLITPKEPRIEMSITCMHCEKVLWHGAYEKGIIGKVKALIKRERWIHHPTEGTLCRDCAEKMFE